MLKLKETRYDTPRFDLSGPQGNAVYLMAHAKRWGDQMRAVIGKSGSEIVAQMMDGDYYNVVATFEYYFGSVCILEMDDQLLEAIQDQLDKLRECGVFELRDLGFELKLSKDD